jgi:hypothetical protein
MVVAHVAGMPVEELLVGVAAFGLTGVGALLAYGAQRTRGWRHPRIRGGAK